MKKQFNTTGTCFPQFHYMMDNSKKIEQVMELIDSGSYFTINRPRQYGKTTTLNFLYNKLDKSNNHIPISLSLQGVDEKWHESDKMFAKMFIEQLAGFFKFSDNTIYTFLQKEKDKVTDMDTLSKAITNLAHKANKKLVLLIDEVDASSNYEPFLSFIGMLRTKYLARTAPQNATFHSIILAGVHDIKSLKYKIRDSKKTEYNSPWNIAIDFKVNMSFTPQEIAPMLAEYSAAEQVQMDIPSISERLYYHTSGYPFLICQLCKDIVEDILPVKPANQQKEWTVDDVEKSVQILLMKNNTNFDSLIKNLENHQDLYDLVFRIVIKGENLNFNPDNSVIKKGILYGVFKRNGRIKIHNRIYEQRIYNYLASNIAIKTNTHNYNYNAQFYLPNQELDVKKILLKFQLFMKEQYSEQDQPFLEREWRLLFLAFLQPILNGGGHDFKEVQISEEKRLDIVITFYQHKYIVELKRWYGPQSHEAGLQQLVDYLDRQHQQRGYLVIFEYRTTKTWRMETIDQKGKEIFAVWI